MKTKLVLLSSLFPGITLLYGIFSLKIDIILNSLFVIVTIFAFFFIDRKFKLFSFKTFTFILIFTLLSQLAGRLGAYEKIKYWDKFLHFISGFILSLTGRDIYYTFKGEKENKKLLKLFSLFFSISGAAFWEIFEFNSDLIFKTHAQNNSLLDTMTDIILGTLSALISLII